MLPTDISGCVLWNDAADYTVSTWPDLSGAGNHWTPTDPPTLVANSFNGRPGVRFATANTNYLQLAGALSLRTIFIVAANCDNTTLHICGNTGALYADSASRLITTFNFAGTITTATAWPGSGNAAIVSVACTPFSGGARILKDDLVCGGGTSTAAVSLLYLGRYASTTVEYFGGDILGVVGYSGALAAGEHSQVVRFLAKRHGLTVNARVAASGRV